MVAAQPVKLVLAGGAALAQTEQAVSEFLAIIGENDPDLHRAGFFQVA